MAFLRSSRSWRFTLLGYHVTDGAVQSYQQTYHRLEIGPCKTRFPQPQSPCSLAPDVHIKKTAPKSGSSSFARWKMHFGRMQKSLLPPLPTVAFGFWTCSNSLPKLYHHLKRYPVCVCVLEWRLERTGWISFNRACVHHFIKTRSGMQSTPNEVRSCFFSVLPSTTDRHGLSLTRVSIPILHYLLASWLARTLELHWFHQ